MSWHYELKPQGDLPQDKMASDLIEVGTEEAEKSSFPIVEILTPRELCVERPDECENESNFEALADAESNYADIYHSYIKGSFSVPSKSFTQAEPDTFAFFLDKNRLTFIDKGNAAHRVLDKITESGVIRSVSTLHFLYVFMKYLMIDDLEYMGNVEDQMEDIEETLMSRDLHISTEQIMKYRRLSMRFTSFYQQLATMAEMLSDDENKMMSREDAQQFEHIENLADRLVSRAEMLREYSLQLYELHQTQIDLKQNSIMQVLTIVTVLLAPMTIVTGWFGMNLTFIPGLTFEFMWLALVLIFVVCTGLLLFLFHRKKWL